MSLVPQRAGNATRRTTACVIGLGDVATLHLDAIDADPEIELVGVCDVDSSRAATASERWAVPGFASVQELLASVRPDVIHVTTPHHQHVPVALAALQAGVHVLTEKPVAHTVAEAERLASTAARSSARVGVVLQNRYNPTSIAIRPRRAASPRSPAAPGPTETRASRTASACVPQDACGSHD